MEQASARLEETVLPITSAAGITTNPDTSSVCTEHPSSKTPTTNLSVLDFLLCASLMNLETKPVRSNDVAIATSLTDQHLQRVVDRLESIPSYNQSADSRSESHDAHAVSSVYNDTESSADEDDTAVLSLEEKVAAVLGPEYTHLVQSVIGTLASGSLWELLQSKSGSRQCASEIENSSSSSSQTPGNSSSPNTTISSSSGGKRKSSNGGDGSDPNEDEPNDRDGNNGRPPKRARKSPSALKPRYDCPISRRSIDMGGSLQPSKSPACAPAGLEFRHVWDHLRKAHYGCEKCGKKLDGKRADMNHLMEREIDQSTCQPNLQENSPFDIGIVQWKAVTAIYDDKTLTHDEKWIKWWRLFSPNAGEMDNPDPRHHDTVTISTADIPTLQGIFQDMWQSDNLLPVLNDEQKQKASILLDKLLRLLPTVHRHRHRKNQPRTERDNLAAMTPQPIAHAAVSLSPFSAPPQEPPDTYPYNAEQQPELDLDVFGF
ncbi:hypothetical protein DL765_002751 [Monosporascus sp. GIB2]|nr:hypothetical protein DL765_002751 [Monosporascus sp. GIB2]